MGLGPPKKMKNGFYSATTLARSALSPLSSRPNRSAVERSEMFFDRASMDLRAHPKKVTMASVQQLLFSNYPRSKRPSPLCHLDRSEA
jgi:hypothetical protein